MKTKVYYLEFWRLCHSVCFLESWHLPLENKSFKITFSDLKIWRCWSTLFNISLMEILNFLVPSSFHLGILLIIKDKCDHIRNKTIDSLKMSSIPCLSPTFCLFSKKFRIFHVSRWRWCGLYFWLVWFFSGFGWLVGFWFFVSLVFLRGCFGFFFWGVNGMFEVLHMGGEGLFLFLVIATVLLHLCLPLYDSMEENHTNKFPVNKK